MLARPFPTRLLPALAAIALVAGCATQPTAEITRFSLGQPIPRDTIALEPQAAADAGSLAFGALAAAITPEFAAIGFAPAPPASAAYIGVIGIAETVRTAAPGGASLSVGGGSGGVGGGVTVPVGGNRAGEIRQTVLSIRIRRRSDSTTVWEGRAVQDRPANAATGITTIAPALARALFADFPGANGATVKVKTR